MTRAVIKSDIPMVIKYKLRESMKVIIPARAGEKAYIKLFRTINRNAKKMILKFTDRFLYKVIIPPMISAKTIIKSASRTTFSIKIS